MPFDISQVVITIVVVCLFLWRASYGTNNGLFAEAAGLIAVIASYAAVAYILKIAGDVLASNFGAVLPKIGCLVVAFIIYGVMNALCSAFRKVKEIPVLGGVDRLLGGILGVVEAFLIVRFLEYVTGIGFFAPVLVVWKYILDTAKAAIPAFFLGF